MLTILKLNISHLGMYNVRIDTALNINIMHTMYSTCFAGGVLLQL